MTELDGGNVFTVSEIAPSEYLPNRGVFLAGILGKARGDGFGLYHGRIEPGCAIAREIPRLSKLPSRRQRTRRPRLWLRPAAAL